MSWLNSPFALVAATLATGLGISNVISGSASGSVLSWVAGAATVFIGLGFVYSRYEVRALELEVVKCQNKRKKTRKRSRRKKKSK